LGEAKGRGEATTRAHTKSQHLRPQDDVEVEYTSKGWKAMQDFSAKSYGQSTIAQETIIGTPVGTPLVGSIDLVQRVDGKLRLSDYKTKITKITFDDGTSINRYWSYFNRSGQYGQSSKIKYAAQINQYKHMCSVRDIELDEAGIYALSVELIAKDTGQRDAEGNVIYKYYIDDVHSAVAAEGYHEKVDKLGWTPLEVTAEVR